MNILQIAVAAALAYVTLVLAAEVLIWRFQPAMAEGVTLVIDGGKTGPIRRTLYGYERDGELFVASNHWFRRWYYAALARQEIEVTGCDAAGTYRVEPALEPDHSALLADYHMGVVLRALCGFAPSRFLRLVPA